MAPIVLNSLREWKLTCPKGELGLVFPTGVGGVESHSNMMSRGFEPLQMAASVTELKPVLDGDKPVLDDAGKPQIIAMAKYGIHALRHACASLWIERGMNPKRIQKLMGHSTIQLTFDRYGHLFKDSDADRRAAEDIQARLLGS